MDYDIFTLDEGLADRIGDVVDKAVLVDMTLKPDCFSIFDISFDKMRRCLDVLERHSMEIEIRAISNGDYVWPNKRYGCVEEALSSFEEGRFYNFN